MDKFFSFCESKGRGFEGRELGINLILPLVAKSISGIIAKGILTGDPYTDLKRIMFESKYRTLVYSEQSILPKLFESVSEKEIYRLFRLSYGGDINRMKLILYSGKLNYAIEYEMLFNAAECGYLEIVQYLIENKKYLCEHIFINRILICSVEAGHIEVAKYALAKGANIDTEDDSCINSAAYNKDVKMARFLVAHGADPRGIINLDWAEWVYRITSTSFSDYSEDKRERRKMGVA